ncbi:Hypothetical predicted protein, partial [Pelobates cultripes]
MFDTPTLIQNTQNQTNSYNIKDYQYKLTKAMNQEVRIIWEVATLEKYLKEKITPRGLRYNKYPTFDKGEEEFIEEWQEMLENFAFTTMRMIIKRRKITLSKLDKDINETQNLLINHTSPEEYETITKNIQKQIEKTETETIQIKKKKYKRDKYDYDNNQVTTYATKKQHIDTPIYANSRQQYNRGHSQYQPTKNYSDVARQGNQHNRNRINSWQRQETSPYERHHFRARSPHVRFPTQQTQPIRITQTQDQERNDIIRKGRERSPILTRNRKEIYRNHITTSNRFDTLKDRQDKDDFFQEGRQKGKYKGAQSPQDISSPPHTPPKRQRNLRGEELGEARHLG